jgi:hypothetical protein
MLVMSRETEGRRGQTGHAGSIDEGVEIMSITEIALLVTMGLTVIVLQLRAREFGLRTLAIPLAVGGWLSYSYIYGAPTLYSDPTLYAIAGLVGAAVGVVGGTLASIWRDGNRIMVRGSAVYAGLLVALVGARLAFAWAAQNAWQVQIRQFCIEHQITGQAPIVAALMLMLVATITASVLIQCGRAAALHMSRTALPSASYR